MWDIIKGREMSPDDETYGGLPPTKPPKGNGSNKVDDLKEEEELWKSCVIEVIRNDRLAYTAVKEADAILAAFRSRFRN